MRQFINIVENTGSRLPTPQELTASIQAKVVEYGGNAYEINNGSCEDFS